PSSHTLPEIEMPRHPASFFPQENEPERPAYEALNHDSQPISMTLSRFNRDFEANVIFQLQDSNATLAPWNSIYIPKHYRMPTPGQRQSSP
ncbi:hypothetical protein BGW38_010126, partial [Lunasporangiospora selenospora]